MTPSSTPDDRGADGGLARVDVLFVGHATVRLDVDGVRLVTDPLLRRSLGPLQRHGALPEPALLDATDVVLVSHGHPDHLDGESLRAVPGSPVVIVPRGLAASIARQAARDVIELRAGETVEVAGLRIEAVDARHWISPGSPRALPVGYLVHGRTTTWFAGDTGRHPGIASLAGRVDLALLPVWTWGPHLGPGHLGPRAAAEVLAELRAPAAVPIHWGTLYPRRLHHVLRGPLHEPGTRFARDAAHAAPAADVRVLRPGEETSFLLPGRR
jgi:L-ascorbate metabolism protein UlaG (beta-lactamase superfamily)